MAEIKAGGRNRPGAVEHGPAGVGRRARPRQLAWILFLFLAGPWASPGHADEPLARLLEPGTVLLLRHALAPGTGDPAGFQLEDCATQRNLSDAGREQARALGDRLRAAGIGEARVYSSRWCRCLETARLLDLGPVQPEPALDSFFQRRSEGPGRTVSALERLRTLPAGPPVVMVTHQVNISSLTGEYTGSGSGVLVRVLPDGRLQNLGAVR
jgi:8-oxo-(d)GTP phosphatase